MLYRNSGQKKASQQAWSSKADLRSVRISSENKSHPVLLKKHQVLNNFDPVLASISSPWDFENPSSLNYLEGSTSPYKYFVSIPSAL